ncbi:hypothetical protein [Streptomyces canus]|uniref:hypothetical protein n=1 Tax=Streptomyces canus TaxID=58343 RepID=UPI002DD9EBD4|nr:hypothetical protein [Streptomyces canus]WSD83219.1 hypothetical protein OG925_02310 [Streptomyces canus]
MEDTLLLHRHKPATVVGLDSYLPDRTRHDRRTLAPDPQTRDRRHPHQCREATR